MAVLVTCKYTVCTHNKLLITDVDVTFNVKVFVCSVKIFFFGVLHVQTPNTNSVKNK